MGELLTIGEVADRAGLATSALRYYDGRGLVEPTTRISDAHDAPQTICGTEPEMKET